jgi:hypothetical protein
MERWLHLSCESTKPSISYVLAPGKVGDRLARVPVRISKSQVPAVPNEG